MPGCLLCNLFENIVSFANTLLFGNRTCR